MGKTFSMKPEVVERVETEYRRIATPLPVPEHVFGLMISLARNIPQESQWVKEGQWKRITGHELWGKTIGIIGMGRVGKQMAKRALAFEMKVLGCDPTWDAPCLPGVSCGEMPDE